MPANSNYDELLSTTLANYVPTLEDNIFTARPLFYALTNGQTIRRVSGGVKIVTPIIHGLNTTAKAYTGTDSLDVTQPDNVSAAEYDWKQFSASIVINGIEEAKNNGEAEIIDLLEGRIMAAEESIIEQMNSMMHTASATTDADANMVISTGGSRAWNGLPDLVDSVGTVGGIDPTATGNGFWASYEESTDTALTVAQMRTAYNSVSVGNDQPNLVLTTQTLYEKYEDLMDANMRYTDTEFADAGFQNLLFKGAPVTFDASCASGVMYFLNSKYLRLVAHTDVWFKPTPFVRRHNVDARYAQILSYGNLTCSNRSRQGLLSAKTA